jgi:hypothetical protein
MILHVQNKRNVIMYIIEKKFNSTLIISFWQNLNKTWNFKVYDFLMFKMKYLINKMQCNTLSQQGWLINDKGICLHLRGQGNKLHKWCVYG